MVCVNVTRVTSWWVTSVSIVVTPLWRHNAVKAAHVWTGVRVQRGFAHAERITKEKDVKQVSYTFRWVVLFVTLFWVGKIVLICHWTEHCSRMIRSSLLDTDYDPVNVKRRWAYILITHQRHFLVYSFPSYFSLKTVDWMVGNYSCQILLTTVVFVVKQISEQ